MSKKPSNFWVNQPALIKLLKEMEFPYEELSKYHFRIMGGIHIIDLWPSRMTYHLHAGEVVSAKEPYYKSQLDFEFNKQQVKKLLETGKL